MIILQPYGLDMSKTNHFSILTPCYNGADFLAECIESVLSQDYPHVEHIIVDDGSTDKSTQIIKSFTRKYPTRIISFKQKHQGHTVALNTLLQHARGDVLLNLNCDDLLLPHACSWANQAFLNFPNCAVIYGDEYIINEQGKTISTFIPQDYDFNKVLCVELVPPEQASFVKRDTFEKVGLYYDTNIKRVPDFELWVRLGMSFSMKHVPGFITKYRWHKKSGGKNYQAIDEFVAEKKLIIDQLLNDKKTPKHIQSLRKRTSVGLARWAAEMRINAYIGKKKTLPQYPLISIITPTYNDGKLLKNCIESTLSQDYPFIEHIITDGNSTDGTKHVIRPYLQEIFQGRIKWMSLKTKIRTDCINQALLQSVGEILILLPATEILMSYTCSWVVANMQLLPKNAVLYADEYIINKNGIPQQIIDSSKYDFQKLLCGELTPPHTFCIRRSIFEKVGFYVDFVFEACMEFELLLRIGLKFPILHVSNVISKHQLPYRNSRNSYSPLQTYNTQKLVIDNILQKYTIPHKFFLRTRAYAAITRNTTVKLFKENNWQQAILFVVRSIILDPLRSSRFYFSYLFKKPVHFYTYKLPRIRR